MRPHALSQVLTLKDKRLLVSQDYSVGTVRDTVYCLPTQEALHSPRLIHKDTRLSAAKDYTVLPREWLEEKEDRVDSVVLGRLDLTLRQLLGREHTAPGPYLIQQQGKNRVAVIHWKNRCLIILAAMIRRWFFPLQALILSIAGLDTDRTQFFRSLS
ncbi:hypothetical protein ElyMa_000164400 [Elysia marginata]|uniref:Uncharacterized protein n=1 Tax=Elysia marginata TaxID=1093978 RepID=A0AAV4ETG3_9GAST|nr:hypothetical protein ElyMa_000164400 [Elysia marginata]